MVVSITLVISKLTGSVESGGYGLEFAEIFKPFAK